MSRENRKGDSGVASIFKLDLTKSIALPTNIKAYYPWAEYFFSYGIAGTALTKLAQYPVSSIYVTAEENADRKEVEKIIRKIKIKEKLVSLGINFHLFGIAYGFPMFPIKKTLVCPSCGQAYLLNDLAKNNKPMYRHDGEKYYFSCQNPKCENKGMESEFKVEESIIQDIGKLNIAVWSPYDVEANENEITGEREWIYTVPSRTAQKIIDSDHFVLCTTPEMYIKAVARKQKIRVNRDKLFVFEAPTIKKDGIPVPPIVRAFQDLYLLSRFESANLSISEDAFNPLRILFPIDRRSGVPIQKKVLLSDWRVKVKTEFDKWKSDHSYIPIVPVEVGMQTFFGDGKLLIVDSQLKAKIGDILAKLGIPIEFIYGGVTWSRQNVSSIVLENLFKSLAEQFQEVLDYITPYVNRKFGNNKKIGIRLKLPKLVEAVAENNYLASANAAGKISDQTYLSRFNLDADEEKKKVGAEVLQTKNIAIEQAKIQASAKAESDRILLAFQKEQRENERIESIKDQLSMAKVKEDEMLLNIRAQKEMLEHQTQVQKGMMREQESAQVRLSNLQMKQHLDSMKGELNLQIENLPEQMKAQAKGEVEAAVLQGKMQEEAQKESQQKAMQEFAEGLPDEVKQKLSALPEEQQQAQIEQMMQQQQIESFENSLPVEVRQQLSGMPEEERNSKIQEMMAQAGQDDQVDPKQQSKEMKEQQKEEKEENDVVSLAIAYNKLQGAEKRKFKHELMVEDTTKFSKVKNIADDMTVQKYTAEIINASSPEKEKQLWTTLQVSHSDLVDDVYRAIHEQQMLQLQAKEYAVRLIDLEGKPEQKTLVNQINDSAPEEFKALVFSAYKEYLKEKTDAGSLRNTIFGEEKEIRSGKNDEAKVIAETLQAMDDKARIALLEGYKYEDPEMYKAIASQMEIK